MLVPHYYYEGTASGGVKGEVGVVLINNGANTLDFLSFAVC